MQKKKNPVTEELLMAADGIDLRNIVRKGEMDNEICYAYISNGHVDLYNTFLEYAGLTHNPTMFTVESGSDYLAIALERGFDLEPIRDTLFNNSRAILHSALSLSLTNAIDYIVYNFSDSVITYFNAIVERFGILPKDVEEHISSLRR
jgi:hypothetical protein